MISQPQNPEFRNNPENFHPWMQHSVASNLALQFAYQNFLKWKKYTLHPENLKWTLPIDKAGKVYFGYYIWVRIDSNNRYASKYIFQIPWTFIGKDRKIVELNQPLSCWTKIYPFSENAVDPDQLASDEVIWSGPPLFFILIEKNAYNLNAAG